MPNSARLPWFATRGKCRVLNWTVVRNAWLLQGPSSSFWLKTRQVFSMDIASLLPRSEGDKFLNVPYEKRWEHLKLVIIQLYLGNYGPNGKSMTIGQVATFMRDNYAFHGASVLPPIAHFRM